MDKLILQTFEVGWFSDDHPLQNHQFRSNNHFYFVRISQAIFQAENVLEPAVLRQMFKLRRKVTQYDFVIAKYKIYQFSGGGDQC